MDIFAQTARPEPDLLYKRGDPNDVRLGETVHTQPDDYAAAEVVLLGLPQDEGVRRNKGRPGAADAPDAIRKCLYKYVALEEFSFFDLGNTLIQENLEATHDAHHEIVRQVLCDGKRLVVLGGGNDTSYPDCSAVAMETSGGLLAMNIDAHFDVRADAVRNSGTPYRQLLEEGHLQPGYFYELAYQPFGNSPTYIHYLTEKGVSAYTVGHVHAVGLQHLLHQILNDSDAEAVFWGLDMDVVRGADAPGVSALNPTGLTGEEFCSIGSVAGSEPRTRLFEICEVNPAYDIDDRTCRLAAAAVWQFLEAVQQQ